MVPRAPKKSQSKPFSNPFVNFQITIVNESVKKRKLNDSSLDTGSSGAFKKPCYLNALSPDLACVMDYSSPLSGRSSGLKVKTQACSSEIKEALSSRLGLEHVKSRSSKDQAGDVEAVQLSPNSEKHLLNISRDFDYDVDDILCLNPLKKEGQGETNKEVKTDLRAVEEDRGYDSSFNPDENKEEHHAESPAVPQFREQASVCGQHFSFLNKDCSASERWPLLKPGKPAVEFLEGDDDVLNIGEPIFESSVCQPSAADEQRSRLSKVLKEPVSICQAYSVGDSTVDTSYETTLPLQVQVKSKVVVANLPESIRKPASFPTREQKAYSANQNRSKAVQRAKCLRIQRPKIYNDEMEWERQKGQYVFSVRSHMTENQATTQGYMTELMDLMTHVAGQRDSNGSQWQHPSDLTCRNYQRQSGNETPSMTLSEWQAMNLIHHKRFSKVPKIFERSSFS
uniref:S100P-binding protein n=2 Tax=Kryptolebias marmoratus TaxID=37003 RepID=A0A3Q3AZ87_KRYMA